DVGVLVLTLVVRASACGDLSRRLHRGSKAVRATARRAWPRAGGPLGAGGSVPGVTEPLLPVSKRQRLPRLRLAGHRTLGVRAELASAADGRRGVGCGMGSAVVAVSLLRQHRPDVLQ